MLVYVGRNSTHFYQQCITKLDSWHGSSFGLSCQGNGVEHVQILDMVFLMRDIWSRNPLSLDHRSRIVDGLLYLKLYSTDYIRNKVNVLNYCTYPTEFARAEIAVSVDVSKKLRVVVNRW